MSFWLKIGIEVFAQQNSTPHNLEKQNNERLLGKKGSARNGFLFLPDQIFQRIERDNRLAPPTKVFICIMLKTFCSYSNVLARHKNNTNQESG
jgi:hypothetical protein